MLIKICKFVFQDNHNPHLELTLSTRKKISSVLEHMNRKWGSCSIASGELTLVPYYVQTLNISNCQKWTRDSVLSAGDVYAATGSPSIFRLRFFFSCLIICFLHIMVSYLFNFS